MDTLLNSTLDKESCIQVKVRSLIFLLKKLDVYGLFKQYASDNRHRKGKYSIASLLMVALEMQLFRSPSKNDFYHHKNLNHRNLAALAHLEDNQFPHVKTIDDAFRLLDPSSLEPILFTLFKKLQTAKLFQNHTRLKTSKYNRLSIDGVCTHIYHPDSQHPCEMCPYCLKRERKLKNGKIKTWYVHMEMIASFIFEGGLQLPVYRYPIHKNAQWNSPSEKTFKQECEQTALPVVLENLRKYFPKLKITILLDGLHANQTSIRALNKFHYDWQIVLKRLKNVKEEVDTTNAKVRTLSQKRFTVTQTASFTNNIDYADTTLHVIDFHEHAEKNASKRFAKKNYIDIHYQWIVSKIIQQENVFRQAEEGRSRWKGEDFFNTAKNRGFHFKHDYSRHPWSQNIWKWLTLLAFMLTSILALSDIGIQARGKQSLCFFMRQMLQELIYLSYDAIFLSPYPKQLRFSLWMNAG